jgi:hypothetical protein
MWVISGSCPKNAIKTNRATSKTTEEEKKNGGKKSHVFFNEHRWIFLKIVLSFVVLLNSPCYETPKKRDKKADKHLNSIKNKTEWV